MAVKKAEGDRQDIKVGCFRLIFSKQCKITTLINDLLIGLFFVAGSILNFAEAMEGYGKILYLLGSLILASRSLQSIKYNTAVSNEWKGRHSYQNSEDEKLSLK
ncbi:YrhK family protein [Sediminibacillus massiliensis]|uniref:YrhK family protein n=1 Tax=Sediminibacillus massiliensis TaxID=1926277 RepID=UPI000BAE41EE|nr:YrhK family protein [Sediminibacillus massiliensis]